MGLLQDTEDGRTSFFLRALPALEEISVEFAVEGNNSFISEDDFPDNFVEIQDTHSAFVDAVYTALARNPANKIKCLYLLNVRVPSPYTSWSSWESKEWRTFLNGLTTIHLIVNAGDGYCGVALEGYCNEVLPLLKPHLRNVTHLSFSPSQNGFLGADFVPMAPEPLSFGANDFPNLEVLNLDYVFMGTAVVDFMRQHAHTLREVKMQHVFVARISLDRGDDVSKPQMTWAGIFTALAAPDVHFSNLVRFELECTEPGEDEQHAELEQGIGGHGETQMEQRYALMDHVSGELMTGFDVEEQRKAIFTTVHGRKRLRKAAEEGV